MQEIIEDYRRSFGPERRNTALAYCVDIGQLCAYLMTNEVYDWTSITTEHNLSYVQWLSECDRYRPSTVARKYAAIRSFFRYLRERDLITQELLVTMTSLGVATPKPEAPQVIRQEHLDQLFACVDEKKPGGLRDLALLQVLCTTGLPTSELLDLDLTDMNVEGASLSCRGRGANRRVLPLTSDTCKRIQRYLEQGRCVRSEEEQALFVNHLGGRLSRQGLWLIIKGYGERIGVGITARILRHTSVISLLRSMDVSQVQERLGCSRSSLNVYLQFLSQEEVIEQREELQVRTGQV